MGLNLAKLLNVLGTAGRLSDGYNSQQNDDENSISSLVKRALNKPNNDPIELSPAQPQTEITSRQMEPTPIGDSTAAMGNPPSIIRRPNRAQDLYESALDNYNNVINSPNPKVPTWANVLTIAGQGLRDFVSGRPDPIRSLGRLRHDAAVTTAGQRLGAAAQQYKLNNDMEDAQARRDLQAAQREYYLDKPEAALRESDRKRQAAEKSNLTRQYNSLPSYSEDDPDDKAFGDAFQQVMGYRPLGKNADTKSEQIIDQRNGQVYVLQTDKQGGQKLLKLTNDDDTPFTIETKEQLASGDKEKQRQLQKLIANNRNVTSIRVAELNGQNRKEVATINQQGASGRTAQTQASNAAKVLAAIEQSAPKGSTPEQIAAKKQQYLNSLPPDVRALIPQQ